MMDSLPNATQEMMVPRVREDDCFEDDRSRNVVHYDKAPVFILGRLHLEKEGLREGGAFPSHKELTISKFLTGDGRGPS